MRTVDGTENGTCVQGRRQFGGDDSTNFVPVRKVLDGCSERQREEDEEAVEHEDRGDRPEHDCQPENHARRREAEGVSYLFVWRRGSLSSLVSSAVPSYRAINL